MGWYSDRMLPRIVDLSLRTSEFTPVRARVLSGLSGEVLEIGFGSGLNLPHYPLGVTRLLAIDPAVAGRKLAAARIAASPVPVEFAGLDAGSLPAGDDSLDHVLSTWTLCTVPDPAGALAEIRRVLRPGGFLHFAEHGLSPEARVARLQRRLNPLQRRVFGGCHLDRPIDQLITAAGLDLTRLKTYYLPGPRFVGYTFEGLATAPGQ
ncbi:MAG TPA: class I SAM-dependent methyltransferase [Streptosporangiaceae bacterium]|nr:class I SAM-dependent methyltransferase [Streptosporangiaceae bacterium]